MPDLFLKSLNITEREERNAADPFTRMKHRLIANLRRQKRAADAMVRGEPYMEPRNITVEENGQRVRKQVNKPIRTWYWRDAEGLVRFSVRVGNKPIEIDKDKTDIVVGDDKELPNAIDLVIKAVEAGELDRTLKTFLQKTKT